MFEQVPTQSNLIPSEHETLAFWKDKGIFNKLRAKNAGKQPWSFLDGPITANNPMGVHHAWGRTLKDLFQRYHAMLGHDGRYQNGFDCQGLWVEVEVEKELGFKTKRDIEAFGVANFVEKCKERVRKYSAIQTQQSIRLGYWMDWDNSYYTMTEENNYTIWHFLKKCHDRNLVYKGMDVMPWCPRCGTGISQHEMHEGYKEVVDPSVIVKMPIRGRQNEYLLVWTTTPWTLTSNVACAVHPDLLYSKVEQNGATYYIGRNCLAQMKGIGETVVIKDIPGSELVGLEYDGPFDELPAAQVAKNVHRVIPWTVVGENEGTGIVHIAPGCGKEDYDLGKECNLPAIAPLDESGNYIEGFGEFTGKFAGKVADEIFKSLREKKVYYKSEPYRHSYPHCWRCNTALLFRNVHEWYITMSWREEIKEVAKQVRWIPEWGMERELDWLDNMRDWMISKKRYWGLALPIWECKCGWFDVIGSREELKERAVEGWDQFEGHTPHKPFIDEVKIKCEKCGKPATRVKDVGNPWLDAGIVAYSTTNYNKDKEYWKKWIPADLVTECFPGQFRNWFYAMLAMSTMMENVPPFKTLLGHALVRDEKGEEMHKSAGNAIWFEDAAEKMGVDVMRWVFCRHNPVHNLNFGYKAGQEIERKVFNTLWNVYAFLTNYARLDGFDPNAPQVPVEERPDIDRWLLSNLQLLVKSANENIQNYSVHLFMEKAERFVEGLSNWYVRRNRRRFWRTRNERDTDKLAAYQTLYTAVTTFNRVIAPICPFITERIYKNLELGANPSAPESVHLCEYPQADESLIDETLSKQMDSVTDVVSAALGIRSEKQLRVRQPLAQMIVAAPDALIREGLERFKDSILDELNVKSLEVRPNLDGVVSQKARVDMSKIGPRLGKEAGKVRAAVAAMNPAEVASELKANGRINIAIDGHDATLMADDIVIDRVWPEHLAGEENPVFTVALDTRVTPELLAEGMARDVVRHVQQLRKDSGLEMSDRIALTFETADETLASAISTWSSYIKAETLASSLDAGTLPADAREAKIGGADIKFSLSKI